MDRHHIFEEHRPHVEGVVRSFIRQNPVFIPHEEDLLAESHVRLLETIDRFFNENRKFDSHFSNYIRISIVTAISDYIRDNSMIRAPKSKWVHCTLTNREDFVFAPEPPEKSYEDVLRELFSVVLDKKDATIIQAKLDGARSAKAVSERTGIPCETVAKRLRAMKARYDKQQ